MNGIMNKINPLIIGNQLHVNGKKIKGIWLRLINKPGVLAEVASKFAECNVNILVINFSRVVEESELGTMFIVADFTKTSCREVINKLKQLDFVKECKAVEPQFKDLLVDLFHFPIVDEEGKRLLIFTEYNMESLVVRLREYFREGGLAFIYHQGRLTGLSLAKTYKSWGIQDVLEALKVNFLRAHALGRYRAEITEYKRKGGGFKIAIKAFDMWECVTAKKFGIRGLSCYFEKGVIAGIVEGYTGSGVKIEETKCLAKGDPYCLFVIDKS